MPFQPRLCDHHRPDIGPPGGLETAPRTSAHRHERVSQYRACTRLTRTTGQSRCSNIGVTAGRALRRVSIEPRPMEITAWDAVRAVGCGLKTLFVMVSELGFHKGALLFPDLAKAASVAARFARPATSATRVFVAECRGSPFLLIPSSFLIEYGRRTADVGRRTAGVGSRTAGRVSSTAPVPIIGTGE